MILPKEGIENRRWFRTGRYRTLLPIHHRRGRHLQLKSNAYPINRNRSYFWPLGCHSFWRIFDVFLSEFIHISLIHLQLPPICNKCSMKQMGEKVKQSGTGDKGHALSLSFCIIHPEEPVHVYGTALERPFHVCSLGIAGGRTPW